MTNQDKEWTRGVYIKQVFEGYNKRGVVRFGKKNVRNEKNQDRV